MPRFPRNCLNTSFFHVMTQGINKKYIFNEQDDTKKYIKFMYELLKEHDVKIIAYCIMNNHAHILIETNDKKELSDYMLRLNCKYAKYYNKKYDRVGYVFRERFKSEGICDEKHLYNCIKYIYNNPVRAGMCDSPEKYPFSNYKPMKNNVEGNYIFIDVEDDEERTYKECINRFLKENNIKLQDLKDDIENLKKLVQILNIEYKMSLRKISSELNIGREKIRRISKL